ncbi:class I ribonucleotide reductase maintenance protein YfaE [Alkalimonas collagenimarina]|uniref:Class I ribonucleotide reductase maintenance protein YfaE n=1 Tax=Alkalimonas collagenimarina TaxID=400390 RepID=A0ABT9H2B3_9GAMM|nr:class I ribonucleotide reductase maintenance protein YfaE [Alkalimonas collagenimarina]MDP4537453.1 class I ribonucleotide reductase maintenance protein YfaE [Alkalimonas collagenimarina]
MPKVRLTSGVELEFDSQANLLDALEQAKQPMNYQCREGFCGACRCTLVSGSIRYLYEPLAFVRKGEFLPCCSVPDSDIDIELP